MFFHVLSFSFIFLHFPSFSFIFLHFLSFFFFLFFFFFLSLKFSFIFCFFFFLSGAHSKSDFFLDLNFVTISLDSSHEKNQFLGPSRVYTVPNTPLLRPLFLFFLLFFSPVFGLFSCFTSCLSVGYHLVISEDQVESRKWWAAGGSSPTFVPESPD